MTNGLPPIIVAVGDGLHEESSLRFAAAEALRTGSPLRVVHVVPEVGPRAARAPVISPELAEPAAHRLLEVATARLRNLTAGKVPIERRVAHGDPADELVRASQSAHMLVVEHRHLSRMHRVFTGSVTAGISAHSRAEVVVVPELWQPAEAAIHRVLLGVGDWRDADALFEHAFDVADQHEAALKVLHAWDLPSVYQDALVDQTAVDEWRHDVVVDIEAAFADAARRHPVVKATVEVVHGRPAEALVKASREADLMVLGRREPAHSRLHHLGSLTRAMLRVAECPVAVVPIA